MTGQCTPTRTAGFYLWDFVTCDREKRSIDRAYQGYINTEKKRARYLGREMESPVVCFVELGKNDIVGLREMDVLFPAAQRKKQALPYSIPLDLDPKGYRATACYTEPPMVRLEEDHIFYRLVFLSAVRTECNRLDLDAVIRTRIEDRLSGADLVGGKDYRLHIFFTFGWSETIVLLSSSDFGCIDGISSTLITTPAGDQTKELLFASAYVINGIAGCYFAQPERIERHSALKAGFTSRTAISIVATNRKTVESGLQDSLDRRVRDLADKYQMRPAHSYGSHDYILHNPRAIETGNDLCQLIRFLKDVGNKVGPAVRRMRTIIETRMDQ